MSVYLVVNNFDGLVSNVIEWDGNQSVVIPDCQIIPIPDTPVGVWLGWKFIDGQWISPDNDNGTIGS